MERKLRFALPKGSLNQEGRWSTEALLLQAGFNIRGYSPSSRNYSPRIENDPELEALVDRPQNMPWRLKDGIFDLAILGSDIAQEWALAGFALERICDLDYGYANLVVAVPIDLPVDDFDSYLNEISQKEIIRCDTEYPLLTQQRIVQNQTYRELFGDGKPTVISKLGKFGNNSRFLITYSSGATESAVAIGAADFIVDSTQTGRSLRENSLKPLETWVSSVAGLYTTKEALMDEWKRDKIEYVRELLEGVVKARSTDYLIFNLPEAKEQEMLGYLSRESLYSKTPTITRNGQYIQIGIEVPKARWLEVFEGLKQYGAEDILRIKPTQIID